MRAIFGILGGLAFLSLMVVYLFRGFGPDETGALFRDTAPLPTNYFSTPESAVRRINVLLAEQDWRQLTQYYDLDESDISRKQLLDGGFFLSQQADLTDPRNYLHPFPPGASFYASRRLGDSDHFEVDVLWLMDTPWVKGQQYLTTFHLKRFPEGYRLLPDRVVTQPLQKVKPEEEDPPAIEGEPN